jgi:four helix bundle protein
MQIIFGDDSRSDVVLKPEKHRMKGDDIAARFEALAAAVIVLVRRLPRDRAGRVMEDELVRSATGGGSNYDEARSAQSRADFVHKISLAAKETREASYWLGVLSRTEEPLRDDALALKREATELTAILMSSAKTAKR